MSVTVAVPVIVTVSFASAMPVRVKSVPFPVAVAALCKVALVRAMPPVMESKGPMLCAAMKNVSKAAVASGESGLSVSANSITFGPTSCGPRAPSADAVPGRANS